MKRAKRTFAASTSASGTASAGNVVMRAETRVTGAGVAVPVR
jgi:hypothetical protein